MRKTKCYTFLTHIERAEIQVRANDRGLTLSEFLRQLVLNELSKHEVRQEALVSQAPTHVMPSAQDLLRDFQFGSVDPIDSTED
jgi:hypothetical protein